MIGRCDGSWRLALITEHKRGGVDSRMLFGKRLNPKNFLSILYELNGN